MAFDVLRRSKAVEILLALQRGGLSITEVQKAVGGSFKTIYERIEELLKANLITDEYLTLDTPNIGFPAVRLIRLTNKGKEITQSMVDSGFVKPLILRKVRERWVIAVLYSLKTISGRTRFMKLLFLLKNELGFTKRELAGFYQFRAGRYGPFSRGLEKDLEELHDDGFIDVKVIATSHAKFSEEQEYSYVYKLVPQGAEVVQEALDNLPPDIVQKLDKLRMFNRMSLIKLLEYIYKNYPKYIKKSTIVERVLRGWSN